MVFGHHQRLRAELPACLRDRERRALRLLIVTAPPATGRRCRGRRPWEEKGRAHRAAAGSRQVPRQGLGTAPPRIDAVVRQASPAL